jgi:RNA polymerase sigma factor (sigma-70 family)
MQDETRDRRLLQDGDITTLLAVQYERMGEFVKLHRLDEDERQEVRQRAILRHSRELRAGARYEGVPLRVVARNLVRWTVREVIAESRARRDREYTPEEWEDIPVEDDAPGLDEYDMKLRMRDLTEGERRVAWLKYWEGMTNEEIADMLQMTRNAVDQALHRARRRIKASWHG